jgi:Ethanolamine utilization protein EutJ (predicted chaperonin)
VTFKNGSKSIGSATLSGGVAAITVSTLPVGTSTITARYGGDSEHAKSTSPPLEQVVNQATSTTTVASSLNPSKVGQKVTFSAKVNSPTTTPTGTVKFMDGGTELGTGILKKGTAKYSTSSLSEGSHNITAVYEGNADISGSTSPVLVQTVN